MRCHAPVLDATMALCAAAAVTERLGLGFSILLLGLRPPSLIAKQMQASSQASGGYPCEQPPTPGAMTCGGLPSKYRRVTRLCISAI